MAQTVVGIFESASEAQNAVENLVNAGFSRNNIDLSTQGATDMTETSDYRTDDDRDNDNRGGIGGFFASLFGDDDAYRDRYTRVGDRNSIVTVHTQSNDDAERAADILDDAGAIDVDERDAQYLSGSYAGFVGDETRTQDVTTNRVTGDENISVPIIEENLQVGKRTVETGGVRLRSRIIERPVEEHLRLREERVRVQRTPVNRPVTDADLTTFKEGEVVVTEHREEAVVAKEARIVEEVSLTKEATERDEVIRDTVRRTDVDVEQLNTGTTTSQTYGTDQTYRQSDSDLDNDRRTTGL